MERYEIVEIVALIIVFFLYLPIKWLHNLSQDSRQTRMAQGFLHIQRFLCHGFSQAVFVKLGTNRAPFQQFLLPAGKEKPRNHAGLRDFGGYGKMEKVSIENSSHSACYKYCSFSILVQSFNRGDTMEYILTGWIMTFCLMCYAVFRWVDWKIKFQGAVRYLLIVLGDRFDYQILVECIREHTKEKLKHLFRKK